MRRIRLFLAKTAGRLLSGGGGRGRGTKPLPMGTGVASNTKTGPVSHLKHIQRKESTPFAESTAVMADKAVAALHLKKGFATEAEPLVEVGKTKALPRTLENTVTIPKGETEDEGFEINEVGKTKALPRTLENTVTIPKGETEDEGFEINENVSKLRKRAERTATEFVTDAVQTAEDKIKLGNRILNVLQDGTAILSRATAVLTGLYLVTQSVKDKAVDFFKMAVDIKDTIKISVAEARKAKAEKPMANEENPAANEGNPAEPDVSEKRDFKKEAKSEKTNDEIEEVTEKAAVAPAEDSISDRSNGWWTSLKSLIFGGES